MMIDNEHLIYGAAIVLFVATISLGLQIAFMRSRRRTIELQIAAKALATHYRAMDKVIKDPALPLSALEFLTAFNEMIRHKEHCNGLTDALSAKSPNQASSSQLIDDLERLSKTRPDISESVQEAVVNGLVVAFSRYPNNTSKIPLVVEALRSTPKREVQIAHQLTYRDISRFQALTA